MLRIINRTDNALSIENFELPERGSLEIDIPYTSNLKMMEKAGMITVLEINPPVVEEVIETPTEVPEEVPSESNEPVEQEVKSRKRNRKTSNN